MCTTTFPDVRIIRPSFYIKLPQYVNQQLTKITKMEVQIMTLSTYKPKNCVSLTYVIIFMPEELWDHEILFINWSHSLSVIRRSCDAERRPYVKITLFHLYVCTYGPVSATQIF